MSTHKNVRVLTDDGACDKARAFHRLCRQLNQYNWQRPHASLDYHPPVRRLGLFVNTLVGLHNQGADHRQRKGAAKWQPLCLAGRNYAQDAALAFFADVSSGSLG